ncbi:MAG: hypothetical protein ABI488_08055 [Polyangiaceae bacterium]
MSCPQCAEIGEDLARCPACGYEFVFRTADGITDTEWLTFVRRASDDGQHFFTENQLYLAYARGRLQVTRYVSQRGKLGLVMIVLGLAIWVYALSVDWGTTMVVGIAVTLAGVAGVGTGVVTRRDPAEREPLRRWLAAWRGKKPLERFIADAELGAATLSEYGVEQAKALIIVQRDILVDLLLKNNAHRELTVLVVAESGYPLALGAEARRLLGAGGALKVIALHDATTEGVSMLGRLSSSKVFALGEHPALDAGLFPADVGQMEELAPAIPKAHFSRVPVDSMTYETMLAGLRGVLGGALSLFTGISDDPAGTDAPVPEAASKDPATAESRV